LNGRDAQVGGTAPDTAALEATLGHVFKNRGLLAQALTHSSALGQRQEGGATASNERLEFLGDRVLGIVIAERLLTMFPREAEGSLAPRFAALVSAPALAAVATACDIAPFVRIAPGQRADDSETAVLADACEALIGALYLDGGLGTAKAFILAHWEERMGANTVPPKDPKTALQEWAQGRALPLPEYRTVSNEGPSHAPMFVMAVSVEGVGEETGSGRSKRHATSAAAAAMLERIAKETARP
jgi:ribonuclease-3